MSAKSINYIFTNHESCEEGGFSSYYPTLYRERYVIQDFTHSHPHNKIPSKDDYQAIYYLKKIKKHLPPLSLLIIYISLKKGNIFLLAFLTIINTT